MAKNPADLVALVRVQVIDPAETDFTDGEILQYLNQAGRILHNMIADRRPDLVQEVKEGDISVSVPYVTLTRFPRRVRRVRVDGRKVDPGAIPGIADVSETGRPEYWYMSGFRYVSFSPTPDSTYGVKVFYVPEYAEMVLSGGPCVYPDQALDMMVEFAALRCGLRNEADMSQEAGLFKNFRGEVVTWLSDLTPVPRGEGFIQPYW